MPRRLYPRSLLLVVAPVLLLLAAMTFVFYDLHWRQTSRKMSQSVAGEIAYILEARTLNTAISEKAIFDQALRTMRIQSEFRPGESLPPNPKRSLFTALDDTLSQELSVSLSQPFWYDISGYDKRVEIRVAVEGGVMAFGVDRDRTFSTTGHMFLFWALGASIVLIALSLAFLRNHVRSVLDLAAAAKAFGRGRDVPGFRPYGATEVREAARAVIDMRGRLNAAAEQRTAVLAGVSHDLRTPITRLKLQLAMAEDSKDVDDMRRDLDEMSALLDEYLSFARGEEAETTQTIELDALVRNIADAQSGSKIVVMTSPRVEIEGRPLAIKRGLSNLVQNALAHAEKVEIRLVDGPKAVDILVDDDGPGIPEDKRDAAFKPFVKFTDETAPIRNSFGLGLALARDGARSHGGDVTLETSPLGGLRARLRLPH